MGINLNGSIGSLYLGSTKIVEAYLGSVKVFGSSQPVIVLPAKTIRFKFSNTNYQPTTGSGSNNTSTIGTWTVVNASQGIWDWYYNNTSWGSNDRKFNLNSTTIGGTVDITIKYAEQIIALLNKANYLEVARGQQGGYRLKNKPEEYRVGDILRASEGNMSPLVCLDNEKECTHEESKCITCAFWSGLERKINEYVNSMTLKDLIK